MFFQRIELLKTINALKRGDLDVIPFINILCDRIEEIEPHIQSLIPEDNRRQRLTNDATKLLAQYPNPEKRPSLFGLPIGIKDLYRVDGFETACGSKLPTSLFEGKEATIVKQLKEAGALILGKTITTEFAYFQPGPTKNPNNTAYTPGGSSSGSAAAVAAGITPLAFGTQTIGSIIRPAAYCGVIGVKPSSQSISIEGIIPFSPTLDHVGFFTHDLEGAEYIASLFCKEWNMMHKEISKDIVIAIPDDAFIKQADDEIVSAFNFTIDKVQKSGFKVLRTSLFKDIEKINTHHKQLAAKEFADTHKNWYAQYSGLYSTHSSQLIEEGLKVSPDSLKGIMNYRAQKMYEVEEMMNKEGIDLWLSPSVLTLPPKGLTSTGSPLMNLPWTFTGLPTITIPVAKAHLNLPLGLQLSGRMNGLKDLFIHTKKIIKEL